MALALQVIGKYSADEEEHQMFNQLQTMQRFSTGTIQRTTSIMETNLITLESHTKHHFMRAGFSPWSCPLNEHQKEEQL